MQMLLEIIQDIPFLAIIHPIVSILVAALTSLFATTNYKTDLAIRPNPRSSTPEVYDFIIVGAGAAGSVIASRLSENSNFTVALLESGGDPLILNTIPVFSAFNLRQPDTDWMYRVVSQKHSSYSYEDNSMPYFRGKSLGGSTNINLMLVMRGNPKDFDNWANLVGSEEWNYSNCLPFFKKSEDYKGNYPDPEFHGANGLLHIEPQMFPKTLNEWLLAAQELGFPNVDPNGRQTQSFVSSDVTTLKGKRWGTYNAFIKPVLHRSNLKIIRYAHVTKITLDSTNKATGVTYERNGEQISMLASKEVIISAGAFNSPQLLLLSGIGPAEHLKSVGIEPKVNLPGVGQNFQDHYGSVIGPFLLNDSVTLNGDRDITLGSLIEYHTNHTGPLMSNYVAGMGLISLLTEDQTWPNVALYQVPLAIDDTLATDMNFLYPMKPSVLTEYFKDFIGWDANFVIINKGLPQSRGWVKLRSSNPHDSPLIDPNYYSNPEDMKTMVEAFKFVVKFYEETQSWKKYNATLIPKHFPGCENHTLKTDEYYECYLRHFTTTMWHASSTCKMGRDDDPMAVLDSKLRVRNVRNLRVADTSSFPEITNANTASPTIMLGEKAADLILKTWT